MIWLVLSILSSTIIILLFRGFANWGVPVFPAIVVNYAVAFGCGWVLFADTYSPLDLFQMEWTRWLLLLGAMFIVIFNLMARVAQTLGVSVSSIAAKMSMVLPITVFLIIDPDDRLTLWKALGIACALAGVVLACLKPERRGSWIHWLGLPVLVLLGSGVIELVLGWYSESVHVTSDADSYVLSSTPFLGALMLGGTVLLVNQVGGKGVSGARWLLGGLVLGTVNFVSILALVKAIQSGVLEKSALFPVNNVGIVLLSAALSAVLFREAFSRQNLAGLALGILAIVLLALPAG
ncbi:MAG: EamA/RhaT family transporter [Flavobacteriales bacterium]